MIDDARHTRLVRGARVTLPVVALVLLSMLFLLARTVNPDDAIPFSDVDVSERAREQQLTAPRFAGLSEDGTAFALAAATARPDPTDPRHMTAKVVNLVLTDPAGATAVIDSLTGEVDTAERDLVLEGDVHIVTSTGYDLRAPRLEGSLGRLNVRAIGGVTGFGPVGRLRADAVHFNEDANGTRRMLFTGGVELVYIPPTD
ncbi:MAG: hypothetical protein WBA25_00170 [Jannaschia sp.]